MNSKKISFLIISLVLVLTWFYFNNSPSDIAHKAPLTQPLETNIERNQEPLPEESFPVIKSLSFSQLMEVGDLNEIKEKIESQPELINEKDNYGNTPLMRALDNENIELAALLLEKGADPKAVNKEGLSVTALAVLSGDFAIYEKVSKLSGEVNPELFAGKKALNHAALNGNTKMVEAILSHSKTEVNHQDNLGQSPLYLASLAGQYEVAALLMKAGANPDLKTKEGLSPKDIAQKERDNKLFEILSNNR